MPGLIPDNFEFTDLKPNQSTSWTDEDSQIAWDMFLDGSPFHVIGKRFGKNAKAAQRQIENQVEFYDRHPVQSKPREHEEWSARNAWVLRQAHHLPIEIISKLLGRSVGFITTKLESKKGLL